MHIYEGFTGKVYEFFTTQTWRLLFGNVCKSNPVHSGSKSSLLNNLCHFQLSPDPASGHAAV